MFQKRLLIRQASSMHTLPCPAVGWACSIPCIPPMGSALPWQGAGSRCSSHHTQGCRGSVQSDGSSVTPPSVAQICWPCPCPACPLHCRCCRGGGAAVSPPCCSPAWHLCVVACEQWADSVTLINTGSAMALCVFVLYVPP